MYSRLAKMRGIAVQTFKRHGVVYYPDADCWLIPFRNSKGNVATLMRYYWTKPKPNKFMLPELPTAILGFERLILADPAKPVYLCEGPFDAMALDYNLGDNRNKYTVVATPGCFKEEWVPHFRGYEVRIVYDNDKGGRQQTERVQKLLTGQATKKTSLKWPDNTPDGYDLNDFVKEHPDTSIVGFVSDNSYKTIAEPKLAWSHGWEGSNDPEVIEWIWPNRLRTKTYASLSGKKGTMKSTMMREIVAAFTHCKPMYDCDKPSMPAGYVIWITAEDNIETARSMLNVAGADMKRVIFLPSTLKDGNPMNLLDHLDEMRQKVREFSVRLIVIDGQNSVIGSNYIGTDMQARWNVTNKLHQFAQQENLCLVGIRNEDSTGRAYGPASMNDLGRCILRAEELESPNDKRYFLLTFERVTDSAPHTHQPIPYSVADLGGSSRKILWGQALEPRNTAEEGSGDNERTTALKAAMVSLAKNSTAAEDTDHDRA
jgi:hypothetical protein